MAQEGMAIGEKWAHSLLPKLKQRVNVRLEKEGIQL